MTFLNDFNTQIYPEWATEYVSYQSILQGLKLTIDWEDSDEQDFQSAIEAEFQKVDNFIMKNEKEIQANISYFNRFANKNDNDTSFNTLLKLKRYIRSNYQALEYLIYQHNTRGSDLMPFFIALNKKYRLDTQRLFPLLLQLGNGGEQEEAVNAKYWVDQSCVSEVWSTLLFHLPMISSTAVRQTYIDDSRFKNYLSSIEWDQNADKIIYQDDDTRREVPRSASDMKPKLKIELDQSVFSKGELKIFFENNITFIRSDDSNNVNKDMFPFAVLDITITPSISGYDWLLVLLNSNLVYPVSCYSNALQGVAHLYHTELPILPAWWPEMTPDSLVQSTIMMMKLNKRKILTNLNQIGYLEQQLTKQLKKEKQIEQVRKERDNDGDLEINGLSDPMTRVEPEQPNSKSKSILGETAVQTIEDRNSWFIDGKASISRDSTLYLDTQLKRKPTFSDYYSSNEKNRIRLIHNPNYTILIEDSEDEAKELKREKKAKKKAKKLKQLLKTTESTIEPKLFFANERTFIHWLQFSALILSAALTLLNFGDKISVISGATFFGISLILALYAFFRYRYRAYIMSNTPYVRYDDIFGPVGLTILIIGAMVLNFVLRWGQPSSTDSYLGINNQTQQQSS